MDKLNDYRQQFSRWWLSEHKSVVFPQEVSGNGSLCRFPHGSLFLSVSCQRVAILLLQGTVFDYYVDEHIVCMVHWSQRVPKFTYTPGEACRCLSGAQWPPLLAPSVELILPTLFFLQTTSHPSLCRLLRPRASAIFLICSCQTSTMSCLWATAVSDVSASIANFS